MLQPGVQKVKTFLISGIYIFFYKKDAKAKYNFLGPWIATADGNYFLNKPVQQVQFVLHEE